jgi:hypothetical protein
LKGPGPCLFSGELSEIHDLPGGDFEDAATLLHKANQRKEISTTSKGPTANIVLQQNKPLALSRTLAFSVEVKSRLKPASFPPESAIASV